MNHETPDILMRICADTRSETARRQHLMPLSAVRARAKAATPPRGFFRALTDATCAGRMSLVAELKRASPSGGAIRPEFDPARLARDYEAGGATCLSVLTDYPYFRGSADDLIDARAAVSLPVLRKDFILEPWQVWESRMIGADCILLIMAVLTDSEAIELEQIARGLDMDVLVEAHDRVELDRALGLQTKLVGINNRNLRSLTTDLAVTEELAPLVPPDHVVISESGLRTHADLVRMAAAGVTSFLVGESLLREADLAAATRKLLGEARLG